MLLKNIPTNEVRRDPYHVHSSSSRAPSLRSGCLNTSASSGEVAEHYDFLAPFYSLIWGEHIHHGLFLRGDESPKPAQEQMIAHCAERAGIQRGARVLDAGCGHGGTAIYLAQKLVCSVTGITISPKQAQRARRNAERAGVTARLTFEIADVEAADFPAAQYDAVWTMESSEHFRDKAAYFQKVARTLKPGGTLLLAAWTGDMQCERVRAVAEWGLCPALQTAQQYIEQIAAAGLEPRSQEDLTQQVARTWEICIRRARLLWPVVKVLPKRHRRFAEGMKTILEAYRSGELGYTVMVARK